jgi:hypothetical protein
MMRRILWIMAMSALIIVGLASLIPLAGMFVIAPLAALLLGAGAGWRAARLQQDQAVVQGARAGVITGMGAWLGVMLAFTIVALVLGNNPEFQAFVQASEPNPEARVPAGWIAPLGVATGMVIGFIVGVFDLALALAGGLLAGLVYRNQHPTAT